MDCFSVKVGEDRKTFEVTFKKGRKKRVVNRKNEKTFFDFLHFTFAVFFFVYLQYKCTLIFEERGKFEQRHENVLFNPQSIVSNVCDPT